MRNLWQAFSGATRTAAAIRVSCILLAATCLTAGPAVAQTRADVGDERAKTLDEIHELRSLQHRVLYLGQRTMQESAGLRERYESLYQAIESVLRDVDADAGDRLERLNQNRAELEKAWESQDTTRVAALVSEQQSLRRSLEPGMATALRRPEIVAARDDLRTQLLAEMRRLDPELNDVLERIEALAGPWISTAAESDEALALWFERSR